jgi:putative cell wall-binding protein
LLAKKSSLPAEVTAYLTANPGLSTHLVGGKSVLDDTVSKEIQALSNADRYGGSNRYGTAKLLAEGFFTTNDSVGFATGTNFPDSLSAGAHLGGPGVRGPLLLVQPTAVPKEVSDYLKANGGRLAGGFIFGGLSAVSQSVEDALESSL